MQLELLEQFETDFPEIPPRSELVSLNPIGVDTAMCEALISYLTRLAGVHVVRPNILVKDVIVPLTHIRLRTATQNFNFNYSRTINSYTSYARIISAAIQRLTLKNDLRLLTFLPWGNLLDPKGSRLLRDHVAVCPDCLDDFRSVGREIYYPLLWYLRPAQICSKHERWLSEVCPSCGRCQNFVSHHSMLGYCSHCGGWLGALRHPVDSVVSAHTISDRDRFMARALEQMIATNGTAENIATHERFIDRLTAYARVLTGGNIKAFEIRLGFQKNVVVNWRDKRSRPRIDMFLELCFRLRQLPIEFLTAEIHADLDARIGQFKKHSASKRIQRTQQEMDHIRRKLMEVIEGPDAPTQLAVAEMLGVNRRVLNHHFPELVRQVSDKHKRVSAVRTEEKRQAKIGKAVAITQAMFDQRKAISKRKVDKALHAEGLTLADSETRHAVKDVIKANFDRNRSRQRDS